MVERLRLRSWTERSRVRFPRWALGFQTFSGFDSLPQHTASSVHPAVNGYLALAGEGIRRRGKELATLLHYAEAQDTMSLYRRVADSLMTRHQPLPFYLFPNPNK